MAKVRVVETAQLRPGRCAVSSDTQGPFLDTGKSVPRYGRIYLSVKWVIQRLKDNDALPEPETDETFEELEQELYELRNVRDQYDQLIEALLPHVPLPEPEVEKVTVTEYRDPTDEEISEWVGRRGRGHPIIEKAKGYEQGSTEEWFSLYGDKRPTTPIEVADEVNEEPIHPDEPMQHFPVHEQLVDLDTVLGQNVKDVLTFAEDKGEGFPAALARREVFVAEREGREPRKGVLKALGFWSDEEEGPFFPDVAQQDLDERVMGGEPHDAGDVDAQGVYPTQNVLEGDPSGLSQLEREVERQEREHFQFTDGEPDDEEELDDEYGEDAEGDSAEDEED